jgi:MoaA/NifB/PqqE/SkfB family radical SAM enzyme
LDLKGVHFLLTYRCDLECDHCFVWASPKAKGVFTLAKIRNILTEAKKLGTVNHVAIEGGEPFLYYPIMVKTVSEAAKMGFHVAVLSNCYWATSSEDAVEWLLPIAETQNVELSLSSDLYHGENWEIEEVKNAAKAAKILNIKAGVITVKQPNNETSSSKEIEGAKVDSWDLMYKGRAFSKLTERATKRPWHEFTKCPYENFLKQERVHVDPLGHVHVCQGISIGNAWRTPFSKIIEQYNPFENPILEPLVRGGPVALAEKFGLSHEEAYADACHFCSAARLVLRSKYPDILVPAQMYGEL